MISAGALFSQIPTGTEAYLVYESSGILYGQSSLSTSAMQIPPGAITHTITASFSLGVKGGSQTTFTKVQSGTPDLSYDPVATGNISEIGDDIYDQDMDDSAVCTSYGTFFSDTSPIPFVDPPEIAGLGYLNAIANTYGTFAPFVDTPSGAEMYSVIYGYNLPIDGVSTGPPQICINGACGTGTSVTDTGFTLGVPWVVTPPNDTGYGQINIPYSVASTATPGTYSLVLSTNGGVTDPTTFVVGDATPVITGVSPTTFVVGQPTSATIAGNNFGTNLPSVALSIPGTTVTVNSGYTDTTVNITVTAGAVGTGTFTITSGGFNGLGFEGSPGQAKTSTRSPTVTSTEPPTYTVTMRAFIRGDYIAAPPIPVCALEYGAWFDGDNRNFMANPPQENPSSNPFRAMQVMTLQPESAASPSGTGGNPFSSSSVGTTREYDEGSLVSSSLDAAGSGKIVNPAINDTVVSCTGGANLVGRGNATLAPAPSSPDKTGTHTVSATFLGKSGNPLEPTLGFVVIDWNVTVSIDHTNPSAVKVSASGTHSCYPAFEIWVTSSSNPSSPYYVWEYGPGGSTPNVGYDENLSYLTACLSGISPVNVNGSTTLPR